MNATQSTAPAPAVSTYGFHSVLQSEEVDGHLVVGFMDPVAVLQMTNDLEVGRVAHEVRQRLDRVRSALVDRSVGSGLT